MMNRKAVLVGLLLMLPDLSVHAQEPLGPPTSDLAALTVDRSSHPRDDSVILYRGVRVEAEAEGSVTYRVRIVRRLLTDLAVEHHGDVRVAFDATRQKLEIHRCRTFMVDGSEVEALPRAFNQVTADRVAICPDRSGLQEMVISYLGVERGCLTELDYSLIDLNPWRPWVEGREFLGDEAPILRGEIVIDTPARLRVATIGNAPALTWKDSPPEHGSFGPVPAIPDEGDLPEAMRIPSLIYSTCPGWETLSGWLLGRITEASIPGEAIAAWASEALASGRPALVDEERIDRVAWLIGERTAEADDEPLSWWLPIRLAERTFGTSCGNRLDRAALAKAALLSYGIDCDLSLVPIAPRLVEEVPALIQFRDIWWSCPTRILSVSRGEAAAIQLADHTEEIVRLLGQEGTQRVPLPPARGSSTIVCRIVEEQAGAVHGQAVIRMGGAICAEFPYGDMPEALRTIAGRWINGVEIAGIEVQAASPETVSVVFSMTGESFGESAGHKRSRFRIPSAPGCDDAGFPSTVALRRRERETAWMMPMLLEEIVRLRFEPKETTHLVLVPAEVRIEAADALLQRTVAPDGKAWEIERHLRIGRRRIEPGDYPGFRDLLLERFEGTGNDLYFEGAEESG